MCHGFELARSSGQQLCRHSQWWLFVVGDIFVTKLSPVGLMVLVVTWLNFGLLLTLN
jgi:hypothetical protein